MKPWQPTRYLNLTRWICSHAFITDIRNSSTDLKCCAQAAIGQHWRFIVDENSDLDKAVADMSAEDRRQFAAVLEMLNGKGKPSQSDLLVKLVIDSKIELFHQSVDEVFCSVPIDKHVETWPLRSMGFRRWLAYEFFLDSQESAGVSIHPGCAQCFGRQSTS